MRFVEIHYCAECSCRIQEGDGRFVEGTAYCSTCHSKKFPRTSRTGIKPVGRRSTPARAVAKPSTAHLPKPAAGTSHAPSARTQRDAPGTSGTLVVVGVVCGIVVLGLLLYVMFSSPKEEPPRRANAGTPTGDSSIAPKKELGADDAASSNAASTSKPATDPMHEMREGVARKDYDTILRDEQNGRLAGNALRKALNDFIGRYGSTAAGRDASAKLEKLPSATPETTPSVNVQSQPGTVPTTGPTGALYSNTFENDADFRDVLKGERVSKGGFDNPGSSLVSVFDKQSNYFTSRIDLKILNRAGVPVQPDSWVRFALFIEEGDNQIACHSGIGDFTYEKFVKGLPRKQWTWVTFRMSDYTKNLKAHNADKPLPGARFHMTAIFACGAGGKATKIYVDDFSIGNGPLP